MEVILVILALGSLAIGILTIWFCIELHKQGPLPITLMNREIFDAYMKTIKKSSTAEEK